MLSDADFFAILTVFIDGLMNEFFYSCGGRSRIMH